MKAIYIIISLFFIINISAETKNKSDEEVIRSYYKFHNDWEFNKLVELYHSDYIQMMSQAMKIKPESFKETILSYLEKGMKLKYKSKEEYKLKNTYKIDSIELDKKEEDLHVYVVTVSVEAHDVKSRGKMVFMIKEEKGLRLVADMGNYETYKNLLIEAEIEAKKP